MLGLVWFGQVLYCPVVRFGCFVVLAGLAWCGLWDFGGLGSVLVGLVWFGLAMLCPVLRFGGFVLLWRVLCGLGFVFVVGLSCFGASCVVWIAVFRRVLWFGLRPFCCVLVGLV